MATKVTYPTEVAVKDVLKERNGERIFLVLKTGAGTRWTHLIDIEHKVNSAAQRRAQPFKLKTDELLLRLSTSAEPELALEKLPELPEVVSGRRALPAFSPSRRLEKYKAIVNDPEKSDGFKLIEALLTFDQPPRADGSRAASSIQSDAFEEMLHRGTRAKRIEQFCKAYPTSPSTVYRTFRRYCQQGLTPNAATDDYDRCGGRGKKRNWNRQPGRGAKLRRLSASAKNNEVRRLLEMAADFYFSFEYRKGKRAQKTMEVALDWIREKYLVERAVYNDSQELVSLKFNRRIVLTRRQLQYHIQQEYSYEERRIRRIGLKKYLLHERPLTGKLRNSRGPGEKFHVDATIVDVYLIGTMLRTKVIGRAVLYLVIDDFTGMVVGFYLTFDPPSWNGAMMALVNAVTPKAEYCRSLGIEITDDDWPASRLCEVLFADQGEVSSVHLAHPLIKHYRVEVQNAPAYRPDLRSVMERRFGIIPAIWNALVPGVVEKDSFARGVEHPAYHAALNIQELRRVVVYAILSYIRRPIRGYPTPPEMVVAGEAPTPLKLWKYGTTVNGCGTRVDAHEFRSKVMARATAFIDAYGICHNGLHYALPSLSLIERQAMARNNSLTTASVEIGYDPADNTEVELFGLGAPISCPLMEGEREKYSDLTYREWEIYRELDATNRGMEKEAGEEHRAMTTHNIAKIGRDAANKTRAALEAADMSKPDIKDMDEMRQLERSLDGGLKKSKGSRPKRTAARPARGAKAKFPMTGGLDTPEAFASQQSRIYDEEGDISVGTARDADAPAGDKARVSTRALREEHARDLLAFLDD